MRFKLVSFCGFWEQIYNIGSCGIAVLFFFFVCIDTERNKQRKFGQKEENEMDYEQEEAELQ